MVTTRIETFCHNFGSPVQLKEIVFLRFADVLKLFLWVRNELLRKGNKKYPSVKDLIEVFGCDITRIWEKASVPVISQQEIIRLTKSYNEKYKKGKKITKSRKFAEEINIFLEYANIAFFDIFVRKV